MDRKFIFRYVLRPHWRRLSAALATVCIIGLADVLEPWPIKIVLDYVIGSKRMPEWLSAVVDKSLGGGKMAVLHFSAALGNAGGSAGGLGPLLRKNLYNKVGQTVSD